MTRTITLALTAAMLAAGCASPAVRQQARMDAYSAYIGQARSYHAVRLEGEAMTITITGANALTLDAPHQPLGPLAPEKTAWQAAGEAITAAAPWAALGFLGYQSRPRAPTVVEQPPPVIVEPVFAP